MSDFVLDFTGAVLGLIGYALFRIIFGIYKNLRRAMWDAWRNA